MEWVLMEPGGIQGLSSNLGSVVDGTYVPADDCEEILGEMLQFLSKEDMGFRVRRRMGLEGLVKRDLVPLIKCEAVQSDFEILKKSIKFLANLTQPIECLATRETVPGGSFNQQMLLDINRMLQEAREACQDRSFMSSLANAMTNVLEAAMGEKLQDEETQMLNRCILLLRNLMYIPCSHSKDQENAPVVNPILRNILDCGVDKIMLQLLVHEQQDCWCTALIQLISLMFKDHTDIWFSGDDVSSWDSVSMMSELSGSDINLLEREMEAVELHDGSSQAQSASDSSDEAAEDRKAADQSGPRKSSSPDLGGSESESGSSSSSRSSGSSNGSRGNNTIIEALKQFACEFVKTAFTHMTNSLMCALLSQSQQVLDSTYFMWSLAFFLKFARYMNIELENYKVVLSHEVVGFLVFEGLKNCETIMLKQMKNTWCPLAHRRLHLIMSALNQLFKTILANVDTSKADQEFLVNVQKHLAQMSDLRQLFLLLVRQHQTHLQGQFYLRDVVETNHLFLLLLERWITAGYCPSQFNMLSHVRQFATPEIMQKYGMLLENFKFNRKNLNNCVLTMMYHVAGDCNRCDVLMQLPILKTFTEIWDSNFPLLQEYNDLMEYVLENFMTMAGEDPNTCALNLFGMREQVSREVTRGVEWQESKARSRWIAEEVNLVSRAVQQQRALQAMVWSAEEEDLLLGWLLELQDTAGIVQIITDRFQEMGIAKSRLEVISAIEKSGWLNESQLMELSSEVENIRQSELSQRESILRELSAIPRKMLLPYLVEQVKKNGHQTHLAWLQRQLLEVAYVKLISKGVAPRETVEEPVARYFTMQNKSVPLMTSTEEQEMALHDVYFYVLLHGLGLFQADDVNTAFIRIPNFWTPVQLLEKAAQLGDLPEGIKFDVERVQEEEDPIFSKLQEEDSDQSGPAPPPSNSPPSTTFRPSPQKALLSDHMWLNYVQECNQKQAEAAIAEKVNKMSDMQYQDKIITAVSSSSNTITNMDTAE